MKGQAPSELTVRLVWMLLFLPAAGGLALMLHGILSSWPDWAFIVAWLFLVIPLLVGTGGLATILRRETPRAEAAAVVRFFLKAPGVPCEVILASGIQPSETTWHPSATSLLNGIPKSRDPLVKETLGALRGCVKPDGTYDTNAIVANADLLRGLLGKLEMPARR